ncbi:MAG: hypothetical protein LBB76_06035 [Azoarcus sp.]|nr:hypothetical protein [Azoarcus sp.]
MHSGLIFVLWAMAVGLMQVTGGAWLAILSVASLAAALLLARAHCVRLLLRVKVLLVVIVVLFAWATPGEAVLVDWPRVSPSHEGLMLAFEHGARLLAVVCWVAMLLARLPAARLVGGLYALCRPFAVIGLSAERVALRLLLVLRYVDAAREPHVRHDWRQWLFASDEAAPVVSFQRESFGWQDALVLVLVLAGLLGICW